MRHAKWILVLALAVGSTGCAGKKRPFWDAPIDGGKAEVTIGALGTADSMDGGMQRGGELGARAPGESPDASLTDLNTEGTAVCDTAGNCECNVNIQSCAALPLCDAGASCEAACPGCLIDDVCVGADAVDPNNPCQVCDPSRSAQGWSSNDGVACDDGTFCTVDDSCQGNDCTGTPRACEDGVACNGVSTCDEAEDRCTPGVNQCNALELCDTESDTCTTTCDGCVIAGVCVQRGAEQSGDPCMVCDTSRSNSAYTVAQGKACGAGPATCSAQDTCDANGACLPNHALEGAPCGNNAATACDLADSCDGRGACLPRLVGNGTACNDNQFCTVADECRGGACTGTGNRNCGAGSSCNETADRCDCQGCLVGGNCFAAGALNGNNACQICDPARNRSAFSANVNARCGSGPTECSAQDTCNNQGQCAANHLPPPTACSSVAGGQCQGDGRCIALAPAALVTVAGGAPTAFSRTLVDATSSPKTWSVQNTGASATSPLRLTNSNALEFQASGNCLDLVLQPGGSCSVSIAFSPRNPGARRANLRLEGGANVAVSVDVEGPARLRNGVPCSSNGSADCDANRCTEWFVDSDGDGFGSRQAIGGHPALLICGDGSAANRPPPFLFVDGCRGNDVELPYVTDPTGRTDCCDNLDSCAASSVNGVFPSREAFPGRTTGSTGAANCAPGIFTADFNCDGFETPVTADLPPPFVDCATVAGVCTGGGRLNEPVCGGTVSSYGCFIINGICQTPAGRGPPTSTPVSCR